jgi:hypothetical protein
VKIHAHAEGVISIARGDCIPIGSRSRTGLGGGIPAGRFEAGRVGDWSVVPIGPLVMDETAGAWIRRCSRRAVGRGISRRPLRGDAQSG